MWKLKEISRNNPYGYANSYSIKDPSSGAAVHFSILIRPKKKGESDKKNINKISDKDRLDFKSFGSDGNVFSNTTTILTISI